MEKDDYSAQSLCEECFLFMPIQQDHICSGISSPDVINHANVKLRNMLDSIHKYHVHLSSTKADHKDYGWGVGGLAFLQQWTTAVLNMTDIPKHKEESDRLNGLQSQAEKMMKWMNDDQEWVCTIKNMHRMLLTVVEGKVAGLTEGLSRDEIVLPQYSEGVEINGPFITRPVIEPCERIRPTMKMTPLVKAPFSQIELPQYSMQRDKHNEERYSAAVNKMKNEMRAAKTCAAKQWSAGSTISNATNAVKQWIFGSMGNANAPQQPESASLTFSWPHTTDSNPTKTAQIPGNASLSGYWPQKSRQSISNPVCGYSSVPTPPPFANFTPRQEQPFRPCPRPGLAVSQISGITGPTLKSHVERRHFSICGSSAASEQSAPKYREGPVVKRTIRRITGEVHDLTSLGDSPSDSELAMYLTSAQRGYRDPIDYARAPVSAREQKQKTDGIGISRETSAYTVGSLDVTDNLRSSDRLPPAPMHADSLPIRHSPISEAVEHHSSERVHDQSHKQRTGPFPINIPDPTIVPMREASSITY